jgi:hypothetical protein
MSAERGKEVINIVNALRWVDQSRVLDGAAGIEIELYSSGEFTVRDEVLVLRIGKTDFLLSRYSDDGDIHTLIYTLTPEEFDQLSTGDPISVRYGRDIETSYDARDFGALDMSQLRPGARIEE